MYQLFTKAAYNAYIFTYNVDYFVRIGNGKYQQNILQKDF